MALKLLVEIPADQDQFEYILEEKNTDSPSRLYIQGPYMISEAVNKNRREYDKEDMYREVQRYITEMVEPKRAMGELNHPTSAEIDLERACHLITSLKMESNIVYGRSQVLSTPFGQIVRCLINDGVKVGMSSRALGKLNEKSNGISRVSDMRLITVDCVADPSYPKAFVNGILESKQFVLEADGRFAEYFENFEAKLKSLPRHDTEVYLKEQIVNFFKFLKA